MAAICLTSLLTLAFIFIGQVNVLAPIVSINFMLTYSFIDYSYFSVAMTFRLQRKEEGGRGPRRGSSRPASRPLIEVTLPNYGSGSKTLRLQGTLLEFTKDMDRMFPSSSSVDGASKQPNGRSTRAAVSRKQKLMDSFALDLNSNLFSEEKETAGDAGSPPPQKEPVMGLSQTERAEGDPPGKVKKAPKFLPIPLKTLFAGAGTKTEQQNVEIKAMRDSVYTKFCNHWVALFGVRRVFLRSSFFGDPEAMCPFVAGP